MLSNEWAESNRSWKLPVEYFFWVESALEAISGLSDFGLRHEHSFTGNDISHGLDAASQDYLVSQLSRTKLEVVSEEDVKSGRRVQFPGNFFFLIDPIDGTYNYWRDLPFVGSSVALMYAQQPIWGVVKDMKSNEIYSGGAFIRAQKDGNTISVSTTSVRSSSVLATGVPQGASLRQIHGSLLGRNFDDIGKIRMFGSAALSLAMLAEGKIDAYWENGIFLWDVAAGLAIVRAAGGSYTLRPRESDFRCETIATNGASHWALG